MQTETIFRALADATRLRILRLLGSMELAVGELAQVLRQSQPRVSRHVAILCDARLAERRREGSWVFLRTVDGRPNPLAGAVARTLAIAEAEDEQFAALCRADREQLDAIRRAREDHAAAYFAQHADAWDHLRQLHSPDPIVEAALAALLQDEPLGDFLDLGTGSGRMAELFAAQAQRVVALDNSPEMLRVARAKLQHLPAQRVELVQGDFHSLPFASHRFSTAMLHQVLHFAIDPARAVAEAGRVLAPGGRIVIVDFAAHQREDLRERHAHVRLGFSDEVIGQLLRAAGLEPEPFVTLEGGELVVKIWPGRKPLTAVRPADLSAAMPLEKRARA
ncbi:metalloregulator ArsR/SmtB family transcription factor [Porphyrobacter sp. GA68]|uniref:ArsR/SmtB family transcription factor n=1 Tax=Porphyrobacter sp. GA68 TaxID=2883480 RepID=UPI001D18A793|nr:metalloregulator ArsR/SmtB family transcription factor [Porphyrobacter sp. GA68]